MKIKINQEFVEKTSNFINSLKKNNLYEYFPTNDGATRAGKKINLGFSCFAIKSLYILDKWKDLEENDKNNWIRYINNFQDISNNSFPKGSFIDQEYLKLISKFRPNKEIKRISKKYLNKEYKRKDTEIDEYIRAETKQAISSLRQVGSKNNINYENHILLNSDLHIYLNSLNWNKPWSAGAQFSGLCVFLETQKISEASYLATKEQLNKFSLNILDKDTGCYFLGKTPSNSELINGTMKVLTGLDWIGTPVHNPTALIDTCLKIQPLGYGCDIVDLVYILYMCSRETTYKKNEIIDYLELVENLIAKHYFQEKGGFSYYENKSQLYYYGLNITRGKSTPDLHGTMLLLWAYSMINFIKEENKTRLNLIKP